jgi:hypothetical protein
LKLEYDEQLSNFAFESSLRRFIEAEISEQRESLNEASTL